MTTVASATGVRTYHTLASVAGAPHEAFSCASSASVVASVVLSTSLNGTETTVAPENASLLGTDAGVTSNTGGASCAGLFGPSLHAATASANLLIGTSSARVRSLSWEPGGPVRRVAVARLRASLGWRGVAAPRKLARERITDLREPPEVRGKDVCDVRPLVARGSAWRRGAVRPVDLLVAHQIARAALAVGWRRVT